MPSSKLKDMQFNVTLVTKAENLHIRETKFAYVMTKLSEYFDH